MLREVHIYAAAQSNPQNSNFQDGSRYIIAFPFLQWLYSTGEFDGNPDPGVLIGTCGR